MSAGGSVTVWIYELKAGNHEAAQRLWDRYFHEMVRLARARLRTSRRRAADEEDAALSAFDSFVSGAENGRFPQLDDRDNLWRLLVVITARKVIDAHQREKRKKRGECKVRGESAWVGASDGSGRDAGIDQVIGPEPTPAFAAEVAEQTQRWLDALPTDELRQVAMRKMEGYSNAEIAKQLSCVERTVERRLKLIRSLLKKEMER
jgi:RNA polymerase sigma factor (sigma-70 family)